VVEIKIDLEKIILIVFFTIFLFTGPGILFDHKVKHDFPFAYSASDSFQHQVRAEAIKDMGNFRYEATYISKGFEDVVGRYPPVLYHLAVIFSYAAGIEVYDAIYFVVVFFSIIGSFVLYFIIKNFNKTVALLSLPISILIFSHPVSIGFLWGHWPSILSQSFLILFFWSIMRLDLDKSFIIMALSLTAVVLTHTSEAIFGMMFLAMFFGIKLLAKKLDIRDIKYIIISFTILFVISFYYLVIFNGTWAKAQHYSFSIQPVWEGNPGFYIGGFGLLLVFMVVGMIFSLQKLKNLHVAFILAFAMLIGGFLNYVGFGLRSFQIRFFWPIYLSVFLGFGLYILIKLIVKKWNFIYTVIIFSILIIFLSLSGMVKTPILKQTNTQVISYIPYLKTATNPGMMNPFHWQAFNWISNNAETDARVYFFYGDIYNQDALLRNSKRVHYQVDPGDFINSIQNKKIKRNYISELPGDSGGSLGVKTSLFGFKDVSLSKTDDFYFGLRDICEFDYFVFDKVSRQQALAQYNVLIASELLKKAFINLVFENEVVVILKNNEIGVDCIEERSF